MIDLDGWTESLSKLDEADLVHPVAPLEATQSELVKVLEVLLPVKLFRVVAGHSSSLRRVGLGSRGSRGSENTNNKEDSLDGCHQCPSRRAALSSRVIVMSKLYAAGSAS